MRSLPDRACASGPYSGGNHLPLVKEKTLMAFLYDTLKEKVRFAARALDLPLGWEGEPFVPPHASHLRAQIVFENQRQATLGMGGLTKIGRAD